MSLVCMRLQPTDALLVLRMQNCNLGERALHTSSPSYEIPSALLERGPLGLGPQRLRAGSMAVADTEAAIDVANQWLDLAGEGGSDVYATLDWHPREHCSFCEIDDHGIDAGSWCVSGVHTVGQTFDKEQRCRDPISVRDYDHNHYTQWPENCIAGTPDARFDPYLRLPSATKAVKYGMDRWSGSYSAWDGGRLSTAPQGQHDTSADVWTQLGPEGGLLAEMRRTPLARLFVMGLETDHTVAQRCASSLPCMHTADAMHMAHICR